MTEYHNPVMLQECVDGLNIKPDGLYIDVTFGGGGHSREILKHLGMDGRLLAFDQDADAKKNLPKDDRLTFIDQNFRYLKNFLRLHKAIPLDGILADLGISSHQIDTPQRGFATRFDGPLDMRMGRKQGMTAAEMINNYPEEKLYSVFKLYGEIANARIVDQHINAAVVIFCGFDCGFGL